MHTEPANQLQAYVLITIFVKTEVCGIGSLNAIISISFSYFIIKIVCI